MDFLRTISRKNEIKLRTNNIIMAHRVVASTHPSTHLMVFFSSCSSSSASSSRSSRGFGERNGMNVSQGRSFSPLRSSSPYSFFPSPSPSLSTTFSSCSSSLFFVDTDGEFIFGGGKLSVGIGRKRDAGSKFIASFGGGVGGWGVGGVG